MVVRREYVPSLDDEHDFMAHVCQAARQDFTVHNEHCTFVTDPRARMAGL